MFSLANKKAVITGGGSGIGRAIAVTFAAQGAAVHVLELTTEAGADTAAAIKAAGGQVTVHACNVASKEEVAAVFASIGQLDILVNNAGVAHIGKADTTPEADFDRVMSINVKGVYQCIAAIALVFVVMLAVFDPIFVSSAFSAFVARVISAVMLAVLEVTLVSSAVILEVLEATLVSSAVMLEVFALTLFVKTNSAA